MALTRDEKNERRRLRRAGLYPTTPPARPPVTHHRVPDLNPVQSAKAHESIGRGKFQPRPNAPITLPRLKFMEMSDD